MPAVVASAPAGEGEDPTTTAQVTDFSLIDANPNSATFNRPVSPRQYLNQVSVWYFGHAS